MEQHISTAAARCRGQNFKVIRQGIASALRAARASAQMTQQQLADRLGVARSQISDWEVGRRPIYAEDLVRIALACTCPLSQILNSTLTDGLEAKDVSLMSVDTKAYK